MPGKLDDRLYFADEAREWMLELHDEHTLWKVSNEDLDDEEYWLIVRDLCETFREETGVPVGCYGRSGRHVCVEDTPMNRLNYHRLRALALTLEAECVRAADAAGQEDGE